MILCVLVKGFCFNQIVMKSDIPDPFFNAEVVFEGESYCEKKILYQPGVDVRVCE